MSQKVGIFEQTCQSYSAAMAQRFGRGSNHASILYRSWFRKGKFDEVGIEPQALELTRAMVEGTEASLPELVREGAGGARKFVLRWNGGDETESVLIPMGAGTTLCVSSQVGCNMGCRFCETGRMGLLRSLSAGEIVQQVFYAEFVLGVKVRNIVFMGMGEPFDNYEAVMKSVKILTDPMGMGFGPSRITISTSGRVPEIYRMMEEVDPALNLAVSVNAPNDPIRTKLMPINRKWNMQALKEAMEAYCSHKRREILVEYVLIRGVNDRLEDADELAAYLRGLKVKVNLIPYNPQSCDRYAPPGIAEREAFLARMRSHGYQTLLRGTKGDQIMAACGQLGNLIPRVIQKSEYAKETP